jgi:hypothetical protein
MIGGILEFGFVLPLVSIYCGGAAEAWPLSGCSAWHADED